MNPRLASLGALLPGTHWYRNWKTGAFHLAAPDWTKSGVARCGRKIRNPGFTVSSPSALRDDLCEHCLNKLLKWRES